MIVRDVQSLNLQGINNAGIEGKCLVSKEDDMGFESFLVTLDQTIDIDPRDGYNHIYYCLEGEGKFQVKNGEFSRFISKDTVVACNMESSVNITVNGDTPLKILITYVKVLNSADNKNLSPLFVSLKDILKDENRNIYWGGGYSRRFLNKKNGFGVSIHNTLCDPECNSKLQYRNNKESCYYIRGPIRYVWNNGKTSHVMQEEQPEGCIFIMDQNDPHSLDTFDKEGENISVFCPPLNGDEVHSLTEDGYSTY